MPTIKLAKFNHENLGEKWRHCVLCGAGTDSTTQATRFYPDCHLVLRDGKYYCKEHYTWRFHHKDIDAHHLHIDEGDRES